MWRKSLFLFFLLCAVSGAPQAENWYLITEGELRSIGTYRKNSEAEKRTWLLQVQKLSVIVGNLEVESASLNSQLRNQRELNQKLTLSFTEYEAAQSLLMSQKTTQIVRLETENEGKSRIIARLVIVLVLTWLGVVVAFILKVLKK
jgi:hypothetical protein